jgi:hypothetical protein
MLLIQQEDALRNPPPVKVNPKELSPTEKAQRRKEALATSFEKEYHERKAKEAAESATAQENGRRVDVFRDYKMTPDEQKMFARTKPELIPELLAEERRNTFLNPAREIKFRECGATPTERALLARAEPDAIPQILMGIRTAVAAKEEKRASLGMYGVLLK